MRFDMLRIAIAGALAALGALLGAGVASAAPADCRVYDTSTTFVAGTTQTIPCNTDGQVIVTTGGGAGTTDVNLTEVGGTAFSAATAGADGVSNTLTGLPAYTRGQVFNGSTWDRARSIQGAQVGGTGVPAVSIAPHNGSAAAVVPVASTAVETGHVIKASAGNLWGFQVTSGASAGYVMVHNTTTVPAAGAVAPLKCYVIAANSTLGVDYDVPVRFGTGISISFSTTGCFTQTDSATAYISAQAS